MLGGATSCSAGRRKTQTNAAGKKTYFNYNSRGELVQTWGDTIYPLEYVFDAYGQRTEMHTFRGGSGWQLSTWPTASTGTTDVTRWIYHEPTGLLQQKRDAANLGANYTYDALGRLRTRTWARLSGGNPLVTTYSIDPNTGDLTQIDYSDTTADVVFTSFDRAGRPTGLSDAAGSHTLAYNSNGELQGDQVAGGILDGVNVTLGYDGFLRRNSLQASRNAVGLMSQTYGYDASSRLQTITGSGQTVTYGYDLTRGLLNTTGYSSGTAISRSYDALGRLQSITTTPPASPAISYTYTYNNLHQRTKVTREDGSYWSYGYNHRGELILGKKYWVDNSPVAGMQFEYGFDNLGNRNSSKSGGNGQGRGLRESTYVANLLNQYTQRTVPGATDIVGTANATATVTVNNQATARKGEYFHKALALDNTAAPVYSQVDVVGVKNAAGPGGEDAVVLKSGNTYLPKTPELFTHDLDGNLTSDGRWSYTWDAENRLIMMEAIATVPPAAKLKLEFAYDSRSRRIQKLVYNWNVGANAYQLQSTTKFVYDGWNLLAELDASNNLIRSYVWGQDLSGTLQGAGGIGGLLVISDSAEIYIPGYDGNGNVVGLTKASIGMSAAAYEYSPFGEALVETGDYTALNRFKFSTKYEDSETTLLYYGYRYYAPSAGRWIRRDPSQESGGTNLYAFVYNGATDLVDSDGRELPVVTEFPPFGRRRVPQPPHDKELKETTTWVYTRHSLDVKCIRGKYDDVRKFVYEEFRTFASFDKPIGNLATAEVDLPNGVAYFDLRGIKGALSDLPVIGNDDKVEVHLKGNRLDEVRGVTAGRHQLVGIRKWRVDKLSEKPLDVKLKTHAYEHARGWFNHVGELVARKDQKLIWEIYLKNVASRVKDRFGGEVADKVEIEGPNPTSPTTNPWADEK